MKILGMELNRPDLALVARGAPISIIVALIVFWISNMFTPSANPARDFIAFSIIVLLMDLATHSGLDPRKHGAKAMIMLSFFYMGLDQLKDMVFRFF